jgi:imidazolonepropionase-like amidohydrolase
MRTLITTALVLLVTTAASADTIVRAAKVYPVSSSPIEAGEVVFDASGMIVAVGSAGSTDPAGHELVDLGELNLYPGLIAATSSLGLTEISAVRPGNDVREIGDHNARLIAYHAINPDSELIPVARQNGVTHVQVIPEGSLVRGRSGVVRTVGWTWEERLESGPNALHLNWPSMSLDRSDDARPMKEQLRQREERVGELDALVDRARSYAASRDIDRNLELEAWGLVVAGEMPVYVHTNGEREIRSAVEWAQRHDLDLVIAGGQEAWRIGELLAEHEVPVVFQRVMNLPSRDADPVWSGYQRAASLHEQGVKLVISLSTGAFSDSQARNLVLHAGMARGHGLPDDAALAAVTLNAAEVAGVGDRLGSLDVGKQATFIAVRGDLLEITDPVERMWIRGEEVLLENRHTRLNERYRNRPASE